MALRSPKQRFAIFAASTAVAAGGVLLPTSAFAASATPHVGTVTTIAATQGSQGQQDAADPAEKWVETTDAPSGITFKLPGKPSVQEFSETGADGTTISGRQYMLAGTDGVVTVFVVYDAPGTQENLKNGLEGVRETFSTEFGETATSTSGKKTTVDGNPALRTDLSTKDDDPQTGSACIIAEENHMVHVLTLGDAADEKAVDEMHQQTLDNVHTPSSSGSSGSSGTSV
ncbi:hypothetical protein H1V43_38965 [Streptomyces sp. PSKA54]|uniref:Uncharacterized protein n=1 Tax=Streptomyces himalayensis subsp. aureolus TaxID=2758039 RepID=A0A7W2D9A4_9ACTN|nr:hypothetical protein [Streptomyces himalayensis]MBA4867162.1 hypothetical protein [Streptomyces himalayensis subsp. aureolus]